jgi:hypothetical protein
MYTMLAHSLDQQCLSQAVVDLVGAGMEQIFALEINLRAAQFVRQALSEKQRRGTPSIAVQQFVEAALKTAIPSSFLVMALQFVQRRHQSLGNIAAAIDAETPRGRRSISQRGSNRERP